MNTEGREDAKGVEEETAVEMGGEEDTVSVGAFSGGELVGGALMLLFFAALGACADPRVAVTAGAPTLAFIAVQLCVHLACCLLIGRRLLGLPAWAGFASRRKSPFTRYTHYFAPDLLWLHRGIHMYEVRAYPVYSFTTGGGERRNETPDEVKRG